MPVGVLSLNYNDWRVKMTDKWLSYKRAAEIVNEHFNLMDEESSGIGTTTISQWVREGKIEAAKIGRRRRVNKEKLIQKLESNLVITGE